MSKRELERIEKEIERRKESGGQQLMFDFDEALGIIQNLKEKADV